MTREQAKQLLPIITAFAEGKTIEVKDHRSNWNEINDPNFDECPAFYRIKPAPKYRPFKNAKECWKEIEKHSHFGWVKLKDEEDSDYKHFEAINNNGIDLYSINVTFEEAFDYYIFVDGSPFGIKEE